MKTRRHFLLDGSATLLGAMLAPGFIHASIWFRPMKAVPVEDLHCSTFTPHLNTSFSVAVANGRELDLELVDARAGGTAGSAGKEEGERFSLLFRGPREKVLGQGIHTFVHAGIGRFDLFIVPVLSRDQSRMAYEAVFNRLSAPPGKKS